MSFFKHATELGLRDHDSLAKYILKHYIAVYVCLGCVYRWFPRGESKLVNHQLLLAKLTHHSLTVIDHDYNNTVLYVLFEVSYMIMLFVFALLQTVVIKRLFKSVVCGDLHYHSHTLSLAFPL